MSDGLVWWFVRLLGLILGVLLLRRVFGFAIGYGGFGGLFGYLANIESSMVVDGGGCGPEMVLKFAQRMT